LARGKEKDRGPPPTLRRKGTEHVAGLLLRKSRVYEKEKCPKKKRGGGRKKHVLLLFQWPVTAGQDEGGSRPGLHKRGAQERALTEGAVLLSHTSFSATRRATPSASVGRKKKREEKFPFERETPRLNDRDLLLNQGKWASGRDAKKGREL